MNRFGAAGSQLHFDSIWEILIFIPIMALGLGVMALLAMGYLNGAKWAFGGLFKSLGSVLTGRFYNLKDEAGECLGGFAVLAITAGATWGVVSLLNMLDGK